MEMLLVTGASGRLGQRVLYHLLNTLELPEKLSAWAGQGVALRHADFEDAKSLATAFAGAQRLLLISTDTLDRPGHRLAQHRAAVEAAVKAGVGHVVYTSMPTPAGSPIPFASDHAGTEAALAESALPGWTVLRNHWYYENLFLWLPSVLPSGKWYSAARNGRIAHVARDDLARAAAIALASQVDGKRILTLSGARAYTTEEIAALVSKTIGAPLEVVHAPVEVVAEGMVRAGLPERVARIFASFDTNTAEGRVAEITGDFKALTGLDPLPFEVWLAKDGRALANYLTA